MIFFEQTDEIFDSKSYSQFVVQHKKTSVTLMVMHLSSLQLIIQRGKSLLNISLKIFKNGNSCFSLLLRTPSCQQQQIGEFTTTQ